MNAEHIGIFARDTVALSRWYLETLGFKVIRTLEKEGRPPIFFLKGEKGMVIEILPTTSSHVARELSDPGYSHIGLVVQDFDQAASSLQSKGVSLHDVRTTSNGWTIGYFNDPEGNRLEIVYRPQ
ncbi:MAG TPA: VOC family protein [Anaerolineae bacterium]|nr:VOC family protein [Anaerolineae bacterium]